MTVTFYNVTDDPRVISKSLGNPVTPAYNNVNLLSSCDVMNPSFLLSYNESILSANYMSVVWNNNLTLYYFINEPILSPGGRMKISGREDVLMSNKDEILALHAYCTRCESKFERFAVDPSVMSLVKTVVTTIPFSGEPFDMSKEYADGNHNYVLTVKGGKINGNS